MEAKHVIHLLKAAFESHPPRGAPPRATTMLCGVIGTVLLAGAASAVEPLAYIEQQRSVSASALGASQSASAPDFGPFDRTVSASSSMGQGSSGTATQHSTLEPGRVTMYGLTSAHGTSGYGGSRLTVQFDVAEPTPFTLEGLGEASSYPDMSSTIRLTGDTQTIIDWAATDAVWTVNRSGVLEPGRYSIDARFSAANAPGFTVTNTYGMTLAIPEPASSAAVVAAAFFLGLPRPMTRARRE